MFVAGDALITECEYGTAARNEPTLGGYSTSQEMCLAFVLYYPAVKLATCVSMTPVAFFFKTLGVDSFYGPSGEMSLLERRLLLRPEAASPPPPSTPAPSTTSVAYGGHPDDDDNQRAIMALRAKQGFSEGEGEGEPQAVAPWPSTGMFGDLVIREPAQYRNKTFAEHLQTLPWTEYELSKIVEEALSSQHLGFCRLVDDQLATVRSRRCHLKPFSTCSENILLVLVEYHIKIKYRYPPLNAKRLLKRFEPKLQVCRHFLSHPLF